VHRKIKILNINLHTEITIFKKFYQENLKFLMIIYLNIKSIKMMQINNQLIYQTDLKSYKDLNKFLIKEI